MQMAMEGGGEETDEHDSWQQDEAVQPAGPPPPAEWCSKHDASEKREKGEPLHRDCKSCGTGITSNYSEWSLCPFCSANQHRCMICGDHSVTSAAANGPPMQPGPAPQGPPPPAVWCPAH